MKDPMVTTIVKKSFQGPGASWNQENFLEAIIHKTVETNSSFYMK